VKETVSSVLVGNGDVCCPSCISYLAWGFGPFAQTGSDQVRQSLYLGGELDNNLASFS
jgi:hypothetical protein